MPLSLTVASFLAPVVMAPSGADHAIRLFGQQELGGKPNLEPVTVATPYVVGGLLVAVDAVVVPFEQCELARPTSAMLQAFVVTLGATTALKWVTGRGWPNAGGDPNARDRLEHPENATRFHWFSWNDGYAWPSGHTATMMAVASSLATVTYHRSWTGYVAYTLTLAVATGMWLGDHHWGSDIVSGGLLGFSIGHSVGLAFREPTPSRPQTTWTLIPWTSPQATGLRLISTF
jgi:membrane-associated phospholipid phosphatase